MCTNQIQLIHGEGDAIMEDGVLSQILALKEMKIDELLAKYSQVFDGEKPTAANAEYLRKKIAYKLQEAVYGGLSDEANTRLEQLITVYDPINNRVLRKIKNPNGSTAPANRDRRLPIPGSIITKIYKGTVLKIKVLEKGFEYEGKYFRSLSRIASAITGNHWNGYLFFNL